MPVTHSYHSGASTEEHENPRLKTTSEVAYFLRVSVRTLQRLMRTSPEHIEPIPWVHIGKSVRWEAKSVLPWLKALERWQASVEEAKAAGKSVGQTIAARNVRGLALREKQQKRSKEKSNAGRLLVENGDLKQLVRQLNSQG